MRYLIPQKIDIDAVMNENPTSSIQRFKKQHLLYILHLLSSIPANNKKLQLTDGFVPINAKALQNRVRNYKQYIEYLVASGILIENKQYIPGKRSRSYKFSKQYQSPVRAIQMGDRKKTEKKAKQPLSKLTKEQKVKYGHLIKWFNHCLKIDQELAMCFLDRELKESLNGLILHSGDSKEENSEHPLQQYNASVMSVNNIAAQLFFLSIDNTGYRLHSPLTNLKSSLRNLLIYNGLNLVSIDINNSQPYLSTLLFNSSFWDSSHHTTDVLTHDSIQMSIEDIFINRRLYESFIMLCKKANNNRMSDLHRYIELVKGGMFYEHMAQYMGREDLNRKEMKSLMFQVLFTDNRFIEQAEAKYKRIFRQHFPDVYQLFNQLKSQDKKTLPKLLQRIESHEILLHITKQIAEKRPTLPLFTIHDSIVTVQGSEQYTARIMEEQLTKTIGFPPKLSITHWKAENLKFSNGEPFNQTLCRA